MNSIFKKCFKTTAIVFLFCFIVVWLTLQTSYGSGSSDYTKYCGGGCVASQNCSGSCSCPDACGSGVVPVSSSCKLFDLSKGPPPSGCGGSTTACCCEVLCPTPTPECGYYAPKSCGGGCPSGKTCTTITSPYKDCFCCPGSSYCPTPTPTPCVSCPGGGIPGHMYCFNVPPSGAGIVECDKYTCQYKSVSPCAAGTVCTSDGCDLSDPACRCTATPTPVLTPTPTPWCGYGEYTYPNCGGPCPTGEQCEGTSNPPSCNCYKIPTTPLPTPPPPAENCEDDWYYWDGCEGKCSTGSCIAVYDDKDGDGNKEEFCRCSQSSSSSSPSSP